ncbi:MAG: insulinase family protein [Candidatus Aminicenantes bacterium]|nr:insulinase family protein [Candidatus Aminicenantes bacterium]
MKKFLYILVFLVVCSLFVSGSCDFSEIKEKVSEFTLPNGLKFILLEDHSVPIATFFTYVNTGGSDEKIGIFGISHFLEHMAFKGTAEIGTTNFKAEKKVFREMDAVFAEILAEKDSLEPDKEKLEKLTAKLEKLKEQAAKYVDSNTFDSLIKRHGGVGLNAGTSKDATMYMVSLPSNKVELWAYLEAARFTAPVYREFYKERDVIKEERRTGVENQPIGKLVEEMLALAFKDHPYRVNGIGPMSNIDHISRQDMIAYFRANYTAKNMVIGIAGDVYPQQLQELARKYFLKIPPGKRNPRVFTVEPKQLGEKTVTIFEDSQPVLILGYHCPSILHEDFVKFSILDNILTSGRSSRLNKKMVIDDKSALALFSMAGMPGNKYPGLYLIFAAPNMKHSNEEMLKTIDAEIEKIKKESVGEAELQSAKTRRRVRLLGGMQSNTGLLMAMLGAEVKLGGWEKVFDNLEKIEKVTTEDIRRLVKKYLTVDNRSVARLEKKKEEQQEQEVKK